MDKKEPKNDRFPEEEYDYPPEGYR
jgi:hypothetical protein